MSCGQKFPCGGTGLVDQMSAEEPASREGCTPTDPPRDETPWFVCSHQCGR
jgi:hypothetical protein